MTRKYGHLASIWAVPVATAWACLACDRSTDFKDSEERAFRASCAAGTRCTVTQTGGPAWPDAKSVLSVVATGRLGGVCNSSPGKPLETPADCRILVCEDDAACPSVDGAARLLCRHGLCVDPSRPLVVADAVMLCLAGTGLSRDAPAQAERFAAAQGCGDPCEVPSQCRQP